MGARSGLSETMAPGTMANLAQSGEPAFRVRFDGRVPAQEQLYWRGPVLGAYDGRTWTRIDAQLRERSARQPLALSVRGKPVGYEVTLEPSSNHWLFALEMPQRLPELDGNIANVSGEFELTTSFPVLARLRYRMTSFLDYRLQKDGVPPDADHWLQLPGNSNPRALLAGLALRAERDPRRRVEAVLQRFRRENYVYTLNPPLLGADAVDDFLYGSRAGFCEHYAGSFVFLMRAAGVPARVVTGYQGGELNPLDGYVTVRQSDAHAWAEVWLPGRGWVRIDPTAAVAPERVRRGLAGAIPPRALRHRRPGALHGHRRREQSLDRPDALCGRGDEQWLEPVGPQLHAATPARGGGARAILALRLALASLASLPDNCVVALANLPAPPGKRSDRCAILGPVFAPGPAGTGAIGR
jgi:transglutaminase-like putative cysteine protease